MAKTKCPGIYKMEAADGAVTWRIKFDLGPDPFTGAKRRQRYETVTGSFKEAKERRTEILSQIKNRTFADPKQSDTLEDWLERWLSGMTESTHRRKTLERYGELLRRHVIPYVGQVKISQLSSLHIAELYATLRKEGKGQAGRRPKDPSKKRPDAKGTGLSEQTVLHVHRVLSRALKVAKRHGLITVNPAESVDAPRPKKRKVKLGFDASRGKVSALDQSQVATLLKGLRGHPLYPVVVTALATGLRRGEVVGLRWSNIDFTQRVIRVTGALEDTREGVRFEATKNESSERVIRMDENLYRVLKAHRNEMAEKALALGFRFGQDTWVFPGVNLDFSAPMQPMYLTSTFPVLARKLGFPGLNFHGLRHSHASLLLTGGTPVTEVSKRLGHSNPTTTLSVYSHLLPQAETKALEVLDSIMGPAVED